VDLVIANTVAELNCASKQTARQSVN